MFFSSFNTMSSEFWGFLGSPGFPNAPVTGDTPAAVEWRGTSINDVPLQEIKRDHITCLQTPVSSEFGVAVCVALNRNELFHAGGATFV